MINDRLVYRHHLWVRLTHWINVVCMTGLLMSGLQIFNAHPALYWGDTSNFGHPLLAIAGYPWLPWLFGGRQSARRIHFVCAFSLLGFVGVHLLMIVVSGLWNNIRSMITGWYDIGEEHG